MNNWLTGFVFDLFSRQDYCLFMRIKLYNDNIVRADKFKNNVPSCVFRVPRSVL